MIDNKDDGHEPRFVKEAPAERNHIPEMWRRDRRRLSPLYMTDTRVDSIVGWSCVLFAILATLGWLLPQLLGLP